MAGDDLAPDGSLAKRADMLANAVQSLYGVMVMRRHLAQACEPLMEALGKLITVKDLVEAASQDDPAQVAVRSRVRRENFPTASGVWFYPFDPKPEDVRHDDIVAGLLHTCRYNGQLPPERGYSVAEHSIKVAAMAEHLVMLEVRAGRLSEDSAHLAALHGLLHDAHEAYLGDIIKPIKASIIHSTGDAWEVIEGRVQAAIYQAYYLAPPSPEVEQAVALADSYALYCECIALRPHLDLTDSRWTWMKVPPEDVAAVGYVRREEPSRLKVRDLFDSEVKRLVHLCGGHVPTEAPPQDEVRTVEQRIADEVHDAALRVGARPATQRGSWRDKVRPASFDVPSQLRDEPEFKEKD